MGHRRRTAVTALSAALLLAGLGACGDDGGSGDGAAPPETTTAPPTTAPPTTTPPTASPTASALMTATPSPSAAPLSRFETDPGVRALRAYNIASSQAVNAKDSTLAAYVAVTTAEQRSDFARFLKAQNGGYVPGPTPTTPVSVRNASATKKVIRTCVLDAGWTLDRKGGKPFNARKVGGNEVTVVVQGGTWKVDSIFNSTSVPCKGVALVEQTFEDLMT